MSKKIPRIYIDTSVVGGYFDEEFQEETQQFFQRLKEREFIFLVSDLLELELSCAPQKVQDLLSEYSSTCFEKILITKDVIELADKYIEEKVVGKSSIEDCRHIALATIYNANVLASWNFKHIVNWERIRGYNSINLREGYHTLEIRTPKEIIRYED